jgi:shikimate kinase/3-dehydroquinate synthase
MSAPHLSDRNITLTGFMGVGKSTVGWILAARLNRRFVDMDAVLVERFGKPIADIFAEEGEEAFRVAEARLCQELADEVNLVISTGGGALVNAQSRQAFEATGTVVCLHAAEETLLARVAATTDRPLLPGEEDERRRRVHTLLQQRRLAYGAIAYQVDTTRLAPAEVADQVIEAAAGDQEARGLNRISVYSPAGDYDLLLGNGILADAGRLLVNRGLRPGLAALVTNDMIRPHAETLAASLAAAGFTPTICQIPEGEQHKTLATVASALRSVSRRGAGSPRRGDQRGRRRDRRHGRLCRGQLSARRALCPGSHLAAGHGRCSRSAARPASICPRARTWSARSSSRPRC